LSGQFGSVRVLLKALKRVCRQIGNFPFALRPRELPGNSAQMRPDSTDNRQIMSSRLLTKIIFPRTRVVGAMSFLLIEIIEFPGACYYIRFSVCMSTYVVSVCRKLNIDLFLLYPDPNDLENVTSCLISRPERNRC